MNYYSESLNAAKIYEVYQTEIEPVKQYLGSEIEFVREHLSEANIIFEIGAGYGRIMRQLASSVKFVYGIDIAENTVALGREYLRECSNCRLSVADIYKFDNGRKYDAVLCLQNGLSAIKGNDLKLVEIALEMLKKGGKAFFSSYSPKFWQTRLAWFQEQSEKGLLGEIDYEKTKEGRIVCKDGFSATTFSIGDLERLGKASKQRYVITEVDDSSIFLIIEKG